MITKPPWTISLIFIFLLFISGCSWFEYEANKCPKANAGGDRGNVLVGTNVELSGRDSIDPDGDRITSYKWSLESIPPDSEAVLKSEDGETTSFTPDKPGEYLIGLVVESDTGCKVSGMDNVLILVIEKPSEEDIITEGIYWSYRGQSYI